MDPATSPPATVEAAPAPSPAPHRPLADSSALVTGAGRGLGRAMALALAAAGARVALVARSHEEVAAVGDDVRASGGEAVALTADVTDAAAVDAAFDAAERALGPLDLVVNNAGAGAEPAPIWEYDPDEWWRIQDVNVRGVFLGTRAAMRRMVPRGRGRVVNVTSRTGNVAVAYASAYSTSKTAVTRLTEIAALEGAPHGVRVFALEPGTVRTAMTQTLIDSAGAERWLPWYRAIFAAGDDVPPDEAAALLVRIARGDADALAGRVLSRADDLDALVAEAAAIAARDGRVLRLAP